MMQEISITFKFPIQTCVAVFAKKKSQDPHSLNQSCLVLTLCDLMTFVSNLCQQSSSFYLALVWRFGMRPFSAQVHLNEVLVRGLQRCETVCLLLRSLYC